MCQERIALISYGLAGGSQKFLILVHTASANSGNFFAIAFECSLIFTARNEVGARLYFHRRLWFCPRGGEYLGTYTPQTRCTPLGPGTPPRTRYQVHSPRPGTPPATRYTPRTRYTPPGPRTPPRPGTPPGSSACQEIRATSGQYAFYWNAFLLKTYACKLMAYLVRKARWNLRFTVLTLSDLVCTVTNLNHNQFLLHQHGSHLLILKLHNLSETCFIFFALTTGQIRKTSASNNFTVNHSVTKRITHSHAFLFSISDSLFINTRPVANGE